MHITKTAGGTLKAALSETKGINVSFIYNAADKERLRSINLSQTDLIFGHVPFGVHKELSLPDETRYMCFLRHPLTRTISHYYHLRNVEKGPIGDRIRQSRDINDFFKNHSHWEFSNFMTKLISGIGPAQPPKGSTVYKDAVENLQNRFDFVGFQEFLPISLRKFSSILGVEIKPVRDINLGRYDPDQVTDETIRKIYELNSQDMRLYKHAMNLFLD